MTQTTAQRLAVIDAKLDGIGAQLSVLCKLYAGEPAEDETEAEPEPELAPVLHLVR